MKKDKITPLGKAVRDAIRQELKPIIKRFDHIDRRITKVDKRLSVIEKRVDSIDDRITKSFTVRLQDFVTNFNKTEFKRKP